jgi:hypothetical protein
MDKHAARMGLAAALLLFAGNAFGQAEDKEPSAVAEVGGAGEWGLKGGSNFGPTTAVEVTPIENWLELESGVTTLFRHGQSEWDTDFLFKKPYTLSDTVEFMFGAGPEWAHAVASGRPPMPLLERLYSILCSGRGRSENSVCIWSRATITVLVSGMSNHLASAAAY